MRRIVWTVWVLVVSAVPAMAQGQTPAPPPAPAPPSTEIGALVDVYYDFYSTRVARDAHAAYRNFDTKHNQFSLSMAQVWLGKTPTAESPVGFKFKLNFGASLHNFIHAPDPGATAYQNIQEAFGSYWAPVGRGLQVDAGVFVTPHGAEVIEAKDNMNYSRGLLFTLAIPYYHSGVRVTYAASDKVTVMGSLTNGWNNIVDNNSGKTIHGSVTIKPTSAVSITENYMFGPEQPDNSDDFRHLSDTLVSYAATPKLTVVGNYDYGREAKKTGLKSSVSWQGLAGYAKYQATPTVAVTPRFEFYNDPDGWTTGYAQKLKELTGTVEFKAADNLLWRIEFRRDWSDVKVFLNQKDDVAQTSQQSIAFGLLYTFTGKIQ